VSPFLCYDDPAAGGQRGCPSLQRLGAQRRTCCKLVEWSRVTPFALQWPKVFLQTVNPPLFVSFRISSPFWKNFVFAKLRQRTVCDPTTPRARRPRSRRHLSFPLSFQLPVQNAACPLNVTFSHGQRLTGREIAVIASGICVLLLYSLFDLRRVPLRS